VFPLFAKPTFINQPAIKQYNFSAGSNFLDRFIWDIGYLRFSTMCASGWNNKVWELRFAIKRFWQWDFYNDPLDRKRGDKRGAVADIINRVAHPQINRVAHPKPPQWPEFGSERPAVNLRLYGYQPGSFNGYHRGRRVFGSDSYVFRDSYELKGKESQKAGKDGGKKNEIGLSAYGSQQASQPPPVFYRLGMGLSFLLGWFLAVAGLYSWAMRGGSAYALAATCFGFLIGLLGQSRPFWFDVWSWMFT